MAAAEHERRPHALIGMALTRLVGPERAPWRLTVDVYEPGAGDDEAVIRRYEVTGPDYNGSGYGVAPQRTVHDIAVGCAIPLDLAREYERLDREYGEKVAALTAKLQQDQRHALYRHRLQRHRDLRNLAEEAE